MHTHLRRIATSAVVVGALASAAVLLSQEQTTLQVQVPGSQQWTATNFTVRNGDRVQFSGTGEIRLSGDPDDRATVAGSLQGRKAPRSPAPQYLAGALIGRIGGGAPFAIGNQTSALQMSANGPLWLGVNDDVVADSSGSFNVTIRLIRRGR